MTGDLARQYDSHITTNDYRRSSIFVIGCDIGTQSAKVVLLNEEAVVVARAARPYATSHPAPGWAEQDPRDWASALQAALADTLQAAAVDGQTVEAIGIAAQVDGVVAVDGHNQPLAPAPIWMDRRAGAEARQLVERIDPLTVRQVTGLNVDASHGGPKLAWLRRRIGEQADAYLVPAAYIVAQLTGRRVIDHANASSLLLYDVAERQWSEPLLEAFDVDPAELGELCPAVEAAGPLQQDVARALGLAADCTVTVGTGDEHAACLAAGVLRPGVIADIAGTAEPVAAAAEEPVRDELGLVETHAHAVADRWLIENPGFVSAGSVRWLAESVLGTDQRQIEQLAREVPAGSEGVLFIPALGGALTPRWNEAARASFTGLAVGHDRRHLSRAVLEGCAFGLRDVVERLVELGLGEGPIRVVGGGAQNQLALQIKASVTGKPVEVAAEPEATAVGAALLAATSAGWYPTLDAAAFATYRSVGEPVVPNPWEQEVYENAYRQYRATFDALEPSPASPL